MKKCICAHKIKSHTFFNQRIILSLECVMCVVCVGEVISENNQYTLFIYIEFLESRV